MRFDVLTIFPSFFTDNPYFEYSILGEAAKAGKIEVHAHDIRDYSKDKHNKVDDTPYGGGAGMVMTCQPIFDAIAAVKEIQKKNLGKAGPVIYMTPQGRTWTQPEAEQTAINHKSIILLCGRYEGIDQRVRDELIDEEISIGEYVLTGGEIPSIVLIDSITRLLPGILGNEDSPEEDSFSEKLDRKKEYPHYTKPFEFRGIQIPEVLRSGNHAEIEKWRRDHLK
ncbi:MAG: tRNA (guanosine(37)-N1)-methyltransferase TrmD [Candidatus Peregrinibacteria bacterium]|nr:tRNA (guanosine(37)-N1)-methyltransferase TrmD [Candidatus Peregrinibacteria bacterium]